MVQSIMQRWQTSCCTRPWRSTKQTWCACPYRCWSFGFLPIRATRTRRRTGPSSACSPRRHHPTRCIPKSASVAARNDTCRLAPCCRSCSIAVLSKVGPVRGSGITSSTTSTAWQVRVILACVKAVQLSSARDALTTPAVWTCPQLVPMPRSHRQSRELSKPLWVTMRADRRNRAAIGKLCWCKRCLLLLDPSHQGAAA